ncbi:MAG TPA: hypothetical protein VHK06_07445 [Candidatus Limnocylindria bacterium]|nr:hypothetical protein [Candidatus Limnocylindria bacterium]
MPFLPVVLLVAWQAISRSAGFALGWATALYFGQVPGDKGRVLAVLSLVSLGWVVVTLGFGVPLLVGAIADEMRIVPRNFEVDRLTVAGLAAAIVLIPPVLPAVVEFAGFDEGRSWRRWLSRVPVSYPAAAALGLAVLQMVVMAPVLTVRRVMRKEKLLQVPLILSPSAADDELVETVGRALRTMGVEDARGEELRGPVSWPLLTVGFAVKHLLGGVVRGRPARIAADGLQIYVYATNIGILGPRDRVHPARAAIEKQMAFGDAYLTWSEASRELEDELKKLHETVSQNGERRRLVAALDRLQERIDSADLKSDEWNVLYRLRLQIERNALLGSSGGQAQSE